MDIRLARAYGARMPEPIRAYGAMNTVHVLERLAVQPMSTRELADNLQINQRTARRILQRLELEHYVTPIKAANRRRWHLTPRLPQLGRVAETSTQPQLTPAMLAMVTPHRCLGQLERAS
jgi:DNA-binding IclR family transcriptional regulator